MKQTWLCCMMAWACCHAQLYAQTGSGDLLIKKFGLKDGIPNQTVLGIEQDSKGYLWVGTASGLARFDGRQFLSFGIHHGLKENYTSNSFQDKQGRIWVYTRHFVHLFDGQRFHHYPFADSARPNYVFGMFQMPDSSIYVLTDNGSFVLHQNKLIRKPLVAGHAYSTCRQVIAHQYGIVINFSHVVVLRRANGACDTLAHAPDEHKASLWFNKVEYYNGKLYLIARDGVYRQTNGRLFPRIFYNNRFPAIFLFQKDSKQRCWIYYTGDYAISVYKNESFDSLQNIIPLEINGYSGFLEDKQGSFWLRAGEGLLQVLPGSVIRPNLAAAKIERIFNIIPLQKSGLIIFSANSGVFQYQTGSLVKNQAWSKAFLKPNGIYDFPDEWVRDKRGNIWMITRGEQLMQIAGDRVINRGEAWGLAEKYNTIAYLPAQDALLLGGWGMVMLHAQNGEKKRVLLNAEKDRIAHVVALEKNVIVYNSEQGPLRLIDTLGQSKNFPFTLQNLQPPFGFPFFKTRGGGILIYNTGNGVVLLNNVANGPYPRIAYANEQNSLAQRVVNAATQDSLSQFWLAGNTGIEVLRMKNDTVFEAIPVYDKQLFQSDYANYNRLVTDSLGKVWYANYTQVYGFDPSTINALQIAPGVNMESVKLLNTKQNINDFAVENLVYNNLPVHPVLPPDANTLQFFFNAIVPGYSGAVWYRYRLINADSTWSEPTKESSIIFDRLSHGTYRFEVQAMTSGKVWSKSDSFTFTVQPSLYNRWWFRLLSLLLALALALSIFGKRIEVIRKQEGIKQEMMRLEMTALKAHMNPHFIYNALNSIQSLVVQKHDDEAIEYIGTFSRLLRQVLNQSDQTSITLNEELTTLGNYIALETLRMGKALNYELHVAENIDTKMEKIPPLTLQPIVENALWHGIGKRQDAGHLAIAIGRSNQFLVVTISDDGAGRSAVAKDDDKKTNTSRGIAITRNRLMHFNDGKLPHPLVITDLFGDNGLSSGTEVKLYIFSQTSIIP